MGISRKHNPAADELESLIAELGEPVEQVPGVDYPAWWCLGRANGHYLQCPKSGSVRAKPGTDCICESLESS